MMAAKVRRIWSGMNCLARLQRDRTYYNDGWVAECCNETVTVSDKGNRGVHGDVVICFCDHSDQKSDI